MFNYELIEKIDLLLVELDPNKNKAYYVLHLADEAYTTMQTQGLAHVIDSKDTDPEIYKKLHQTTQGLLSNTRIASIDFILSLERLKAVLKDYINLAKLPELTIYTTLFTDLANLTTTFDRVTRYPEPFTLLGFVFSGQKTFNQLATLKECLIFTKECLITKLSKEEVESFETSTITLVFEYERRTTARDVSQKVKAIVVLYELISQVLGEGDKQLEVIEIETGSPMIFLWLLGRLKSIIATKKALRTFIAYMWRNHSDEGVIHSFGENMEAIRKGLEEVEKIQKIKLFGVLEEAKERVLLHSMNSLLPRQHKIKMDGHLIVEAKAVEPDKPLLPPYQHLQLPAPKEAEQKQIVEQAETQPKENPENKQNPNVSQ